MEDQINGVLRTDYLSINEVIIYGFNDNET